MERREFVEKLGLGSAVALVTGGAIVTGTGAGGSWGSAPVPVSGDATRAPRASSEWLRSRCLPRA